MTEARDDWTAPGWAVRPFLDGGRAGPTGVDRTEVDLDPDQEAGPGGRTVRPFVVTGGRTAGDGDLAIEAQVVTTKRGQEALPTLAFEYADIVALCVEPLAVAEVSARLRLHLGETRVLLRDLTRSGHVTTFRPDTGLTEDVRTIQRVIDGLRQLS